MPEADFSALDAVGLNLHAVFALDQLPDALRDALHNECDPARSYSQLILIGNGGRALWQTIQREGGHSANPRDLALLHIWRTLRQKGGTGLQ